MTGTSATAPLIDGYDGIVCDLDGVIYRGHEAVPHAVESLLSALSGGVRVVYATNNASRAPEDVASHLDSLGLPGPGARVVTSAQAGARYVARHCPPGSRVLAVGGPGVSLALQEEGLLPVTAPAGSAPAGSAPAASALGTGQPVVAVLQGYGAAVDWADLAEAGYAVQAGALWVATNLDITIPTHRGIAPGNGALVSAVRQVVSVDPVVVGKPNTPLYELSVSVLGTRVDRTLAIGDRLDTDIMGATAAGMESLFVFGGVHGWADLAGADQLSRPRFIATDLRCLHAAYQEPVRDPQDDARWLCGGAHAGVSASGNLLVSGSGTLNDRLRAAVTALWHETDVRGRAIDGRSGDGAALSDEVGAAVARHS